MPAYFAILRGKTPWTARPIIASADPQVVRVAFAALLRLIDQAETEPEDDPDAEAIAGPLGDR